MNPLNHVAIIMDGNGRWGIRNRNSRNEGHREGLNTLEKIINEAVKLDIKYLTLYAFSTENWKRPKKEISFLFDLLKKFLTNKLTKLNKQNIKLKFFGERKFDKEINHLLNISEKKTINNSKLQINIALNYGSRNELLNAIRKINKSNMKITELNFSRFLDTTDIPDPEILIRTGNTKRLSNFLLWQLAYTEIFFEKKLWPDFNIIDFNRIIINYKKIKRNFGDI